MWLVCIFTGIGEHLIAVANHQKNETHEKAHCMCPAILFVCFVLFEVVL